MKRFLLLSPDALESSDLGKTPSEDANRADEAQRQAELASGIQRSLPAMDSGGSGGTNPGSPGEFAKPPGQRGRPAKPDDQLKEPRRKPLKNVPTAPGSFTAPPPTPEVSTPAPVYQEPPVEVLSDSDAEECGKILFEIEDGIIAVKRDPLIAIAHRKLPKDTVDNIALKLVPSERTRANLEKGFANICKAMNVSPKVISGIGFIAAQRSYITSQLAGLRELKEALEKMPDRPADA